MCPGPSVIKNISDNVFCLFLVLNLFYRSPMVYLKENYTFPKFLRVSNIFQGRGGVKLFPGGGGGPIAYLQ